MHPHRSAVSSLHCVRSVTESSLMKCCKHSLSKHGGSAITVQVLISMGTVRSKTQLLHIYSRSENTNTLQNAIDVFNSVRAAAQQDIFVVSNMMKCYIQHQQAHQAINLHHRFEGEHDDVSNILLLKACIKCQQFEIGKQCIGKRMMRHRMGEMQSIEFLNTAIDFYCYTKDIVLALHVFEHIPRNQRNEVTVSALMKCFMSCQQHQRAIRLLEEYGSEPDDTLNVLYMKCCIHENEIEKGRQLIIKYMRDSYRRSAHFIATVIEFHSHINEVDTALQVFNSVPCQKHNTILMNVMMSGLINNHKSINAIRLYEDCSHLQKNDASNVLYLKACIASQQYEKGGALIDAYVANKHSSKASAQFQNTAIDFYGHIGDISNAFRMYQEVVKTSDCAQKHIGLSIMMKCYMTAEQPLRAIDLFDTDCDDETVSSDVCSMLYLKACVSAKQHHKARRLIDRCLSRHLHARSVPFINCCIDFYNQIGSMGEAVVVFMRIDSDRIDAITISTMMNGFIKHHQSDKAIQLYQQYGLRTVGNDVCNTLFLKACIESDNFESGECLIMQCMNDLGQRSIELVTAVIDFYGHFAKLSRALHIYDSIGLDRMNSVSTNAMMQAYAVNDEFESALQLFGTTHYDHLDAISYSIALDCYGQLLFIESAETLIASLQTDETKKQIAESSDFVSAVIRMYSKCGQHHKALQYFEAIGDSVLKKDSNGFIFTAIMDSFAKQGNANKVLSLFYDAQKTPNVTASSSVYSIAINACAHCGLIDEAKRIYDSIAQPNVTVTNCILDAFARKNKLDAAEQIYRKFWTRRSSKCSIKPGEYYAPKMNMISSLLSACATHNDLERGERIFSEIRIEFDLDTTTVIDKQFTAVYILMCNLYGQNRQHGQFAMIDGEMERKGLK